MINFVAFTRRRMAAVEHQVRTSWVRCLDTLVGSDGCDIAAELAAMLPMRARGMPLVAEAGQIAVRNKTDADQRTRPGQPMDVEEDAVANGDMCAEYIEWRANRASDDLMTPLVNATFEDEHGAAARATRRNASAARQGVPGSARSFAAVVRPVNSTMRTAARVRASKFARSILSGVSTLSNRYHGAARKLTIGTPAMW